MNYLKNNFILLFFLLVSCEVEDTSYSNEIVFLKDYPGANGRYVTFTPVLKADHTVKLGPTIGADYGHLSFFDVDGDGVKEAIVETRKQKFNLEHSDYSKTILKFYYEKKFFVILENQ